MYQATSGVHSRRRRRRPRLVARDLVSLLLLCIVVVMIRCLWPKRHILHRLCPFWSSRLVPALLSFPVLSFVVCLGPRKLVVDVFGTC
jgi:hypothetical protein